MYGGQGLGLSGFCRKLPKIIHGRAFICGPQLGHPTYSLMNPVQSPRKVVVKARLIEHGTLNPRVSLRNSHLRCPGPMVYGGLEF